MPRFGDNSLETINEAAENVTPRNTKKCKRSVWAQFTHFCQEKKYDLGASTTVDQLGVILKDWAFNMRRKNGENYKECVVKIMWNSTAKQLQELYYKSYGLKFNPFSDPEFSSARMARDSKRKMLQADPSKRKESSSAVSVEQLYRMVDLCDEDTPLGLEKKFFLIAGYELAWRGGEGCNCLVYFFKEETTIEGENTGRVEYNPIFSKTAQGGAKKLADSKWLTSNEKNPEICPVRLLRKLLGKRPHHVKSDRLFLTPNPNWKNETSRGWYKNCPVGRNEISKWMATSAQEIGIDVGRVKITNHSIRATAVTNLAKNGVEEQQLTKITGHNNVHSIRPYLQMDVEHHQKIIDTMRNESGISTSYASSNIAPGQQVATYNNCNFYYNK